ncbi:tRNA guanosine(34) transglycosylase Tgt [Petralouisia muris]|jgi:queuine tRNA-ribosyltransferase|uniref:tRNA guanosine(34) transglycosylase Tgt n=1 Tax=Petralouisia muris TaxID=3032872 RepID=A0AC61RRK9_9FIRM|nr:tRNA guanosine(34) transglycosylase Tgt [Petralouisia muris]TGY91485.1 tRNA guanosine(34) transglycosylase Tgt [Petralouisia muris]
MYKLLKQEGRAKRGEFHTVHGIIQTPVFMNVGTAAAIKGAVSTQDLQQIKTQVQLSNTYHLHVRPGDELIKEMGGLHKFMVWDKPILTDSGGFQVFSLAGLRKIKEEGVYFNSHIDGKKIFMGPEESMQIQSHLASTIAMAFDECPSSVAERSYVEASVARTARWLKRCKAELGRLNQMEDTINKHQMLFGINQGAIFDDIRIEHAKQISQLDLDGYAIGGLAVGESHEEMYHILDVTVPHLPLEKPTYLMGVGTPANILEGVERGVDFFDCVYPSRNGRHGHLYTNQGKINLFNQKYERDPKPIEEGCQCPACRHYSRAYIRHLLKAKEMLGMRLCVLHNLYFYNTMMEEIRDALDQGRFHAYKEEKLYGMGQRNM